MTRERLESLSFETLLKVADQEGIDASRDSDREYLINTVLEVQEENRQERDAVNNNPIRIEQKKYDNSFEQLIVDTEEDFPLPENYNVTRVKLLLRDPYWAFSYWDLSNKLKAELENDVNLNGMYLRMSMLEDPASMKVTDYFDISIQLSDRSWYINLPNQDQYYRLELISISGTRESVHSRSNIIHVPEGTIKESSSGKTDKDVLISMSGIQNLGMSVFSNGFSEEMETNSGIHFPG